MNVLMVGGSDRGGGAQQVTASLVDGLRAEGHAVTSAVGFQYGDDPDVRLIPNDEARRRSVHAARRLGKPLKRYGYPGLLAARAVELGVQPRRLARKLRGDEDFDFPGTWQLLDLPPAPPDIIHLHNLHGGYFDLRALPWLSRAAPVVLTLHDAWLMTGHCAHAIHGERWRQGCGDCPDLSVYPAVPRDRTAANLARKRSIYRAARFTPVAPSRWLAERAQQSALAEGSTGVRVIPNGIDLGRFSPSDRARARADLDIDQDADVLLFAANGTRTNAFKDFPTLEATIARLGARPRPRPLLAVSVGEEGPSRRSGSAELRMVGHLAAAEALVAWYRAADVYVHPARIDTFPTTVIEALACGLPVVASAVGGIPEQVVDGQTGALVPRGDAAAMAEAIERLLGDPASRARQGAAARKRAEAYFNRDRMVDAYVGLYRELTGRARPEANRSASSSDSSAMRSA